MVATQLHVSAHVHLDAEPAVEWHCNHFDIDESSTYRVVIEGLNHLFVNGTRQQMYDFARALINATNDPRSQLPVTTEAAEEVSF